MKLEQNITLTPSTELRYGTVSYLMPEILAFEKNILAAMSKTFASSLYKIQVSHFQIGNYLN
jgi:hypothetical protein